MQSNNVSCKLQLVREDDFVEYFLFPEQKNASLEEIQQRKHMEEFLKDCKSITDRHIAERNYIWHKDEFNLTIRTSAEQILLDDQQNTEPGEQGKNNSKLLCLDNESLLKLT